MNIEIEAERVYSGVVVCCTKCGMNSVLKQLSDMNKNKQIKQIESIDYKNKNYLVLTKCRGHANVK